MFRNPSIYFYQLRLKIPHTTIDLPSDDVLEKKVCGHHMGVFPEYMMTPGGILSREKPLGLVILGSL